jgi:hypothetical protein
LFIVLGFVVAGFGTRRRNDHVWNRPRSTHQYQLSSRP